MKRLLLASAVLGLAGSIGTANAAPDTSNTVQFWNATTPGDDAGTISAQPWEQALPSAAPLLAAMTGALVVPSTPPGTPYSAAINYSLGTGGTDTIAGFFNANSPSIGPPSSCDSACQGTTLSTTGYTKTTLFEFTFTTGAETFNVTHDDGVSLFHTGMEGACDQTSCPNDLLPLSASQPTNPVNTAAIFLPAGIYDLWYTAANGLPEDLQTNSVPVPAPLIGHGLLVLLAVGGVLFGGKLLENSKKQAA